MTVPLPANQLLRAGSVQMESLPADKEANFAKLERFAEQAAAQGVRLLLFPECCITGYWFIRNLSLEQLAALASLQTNRVSEQKAALNLLRSLGSD